MPIKLLVACREQHPAVDLCARIVQVVGGRIVGEATPIDSALRRAAVTSPDVLLLEYATRRAQDARRVLSRIAQVSANTRVLLLCHAYTHRSIVGFIRRGASGCLLASSEPSLCAKAVSTVQQGEIWFGRMELLQALRSQIDAGPRPRSGTLDEQAPLTAREREILALIGDAMSNKEIARQLRISHQTVKTHLHHIYVKLEKSGRYKAFLSNPVAGRSPRAAPGRGLQQGRSSGR